MMDLSRAISAGEKGRATARERNHMRILTAAVFVLASAVPAFAGTQKVPQQHATIQAAVDAAADGDSIVVSGGPYHENVVIAGKTGLKLIGKKATWDGNVNGVVGSCLSGSTTGMTIQGFRFRSGDETIDLTGDGITIQKCVFRASWDRCVVVTGNGFKFLKNTVKNVYDGVSVESDDAVFEKNTFRGSEHRHIYVWGARAAVRKNKFSRCDDEAVYVEGDDAMLSQNSVRNCDDYGLYVEGIDATFERNSMGSSYGGIYLNGSSSTITGNTCHATHHRGIEVDGNDNLIEGNEVSSTYYDNYSIYGDRNQILGNSASDAVDDYGIIAAGDEVVIEGNTVARTEWCGIFLDGTGAIVRGNSVTDTWRDDGIEVYGGLPGAIVEDNDVSNTRYSGIYVDSSGATVSGNTTTDCGYHYDGGFYIDGSDNELDSNTATGSGYCGFRICGSNTTLTDCVAVDSGINGFLIEDSGCSLDGCSSRGSDGQGLFNDAANTTVTDSVFLGNALDLASSFVFTGGIGGIDFLTGGEAQAALYFFYPD